MRAQTEKWLSWQNTTADGILLKGGLYYSVVTTLIYKVKKNGGVWAPPRG